jgi:uncharacterized protein
LIVYSATKSKFQDDVMTNDIGGIIFDAFRTATGKHTSESEIRSWMSSLQYMDRVLNDDDIPFDAGVAIEYHLPQTSKRIDFILTGQDKDRRESAVLVELKQWQKAELTQSDAVVITRFKHGPAETLHPSYQAWSYKRLLEDFNQTVQEELIGLYPCAYLHNYEDDGVITHPFFSEHIKRAPVFLKSDALKLQQFIKTHVRYGDTTRIMYRIDHGKIKPSKNLADELASMLRGNREFVLIDDQKVVFEKAKSLAEQASEHNKKVFIVEGGPGTGKSVLAINLMVELTGKDFVVQYVTRNSAPRLVYEAKLTGHYRKTHISNMFSGSGSYHAVPSNMFGCLIVDEAHRLNEKSGMFNHLGENQIKEIINASKLSVFFIDEDQKVTLKDIGDREEICNWAEKLGAEVIEATLESQFRCNGSNGYLAWLDDTLRIRKTANETLDSREYDFRIVDTPTELHELIRAKNNKNNKARMPADEESSSALPFRHLKPDEVRPYENCVPLYELKIAAGGFSDEQQIEECEWLALPEEFRPRKGLFVAQVVGESMNRRIPNGAWCLFREDKGGSRIGKVVLAWHREISDTETSGHYTVKIYESTKENLIDGSWRHTSIILRPDSYLPRYEPIVLSKEQAEDLRVIGELVAVLG